MITITGSWLGEATVNEVTATIPIRVTWSDEDPLILTCEFDGTRWEIGRDLVREALALPARTVGEGDVRISATMTSLFFALSTTEGEALVWMPKERMRGFLVKAYSIVAEGSEKLDVDSTITKILEGA